MKIDCPRSDEASAWLADELSANDAAAYASHVAGCAACAAAVASTKRLMHRLRSVPSVEPAKDFSERIMARVQAENVTLHTPPNVWARGAAAVGALAAVFAVMAGGWFWQTPTGGPAAPNASLPSVATDSQAVANLNLNRGLDWFCQHQEADGSWHAEKWGGNEQFQVALTALPALALYRAETPTPQYTEAANRAVEWLRQHQTAEGSFGPRFQGTPYNQSIATLAMLHAYRANPSHEGLRESLNISLRDIVSRQTSDGGWGYLRGRVADASITIWHAEALALATNLGWPECAAQLERARVWLAEHDESAAESPEPADSPSATIPRAVAAGRSGMEWDFYRAYFLSSSFREPGLERKLAAMRETLRSNQVTEGAQSGTWDPDKRWGVVGGRLYSTSLALLSLRDR